MTVGLICLAAVLLLAFMRVPLGIALLTVSIGGTSTTSRSAPSITVLPIAMTLK